MARRDITKSMMAEFLGVRLATLSEKMSGKYPFTFDECLKIKEFLGVDMPVDELFLKAVKV